MRRFLKWLIKWTYLVVSGLCFLLVLGILCTAGYLWLSGDLNKIAREYRDTQITHLRSADHGLEESDINHLNKNQVVDNGNDVVLIDSISAVENKINARSIMGETDSAGSPRFIILHLANGDQKKIEIEEILFAEVQKNYHLIYIAGCEVYGQKIDQRRSSLIKIYELCKPYGNFFSSRKHLINCCQISQLHKSSHKVTMQNGKTISIPIKRFSEIRNCFDEIDC